MLRHRMPWLFGFVAFVLTGLLAPPSTVLRARAAPHPTTTCDQAPSLPSTHQVDNLDQIAANWGVYCEASPITGGDPTWLKQNTTAPALDDQALQCSLTGGAPYANIHCYRDLLPEPATIGITFTLAFQFLPGSTCT